MKGRNNILFITAFSLIVGLSTTPRSAIKPPQREQIYESLKSNLQLFANHLYTIDEITFFKVVSITKDSKSVIKLELSVSNLDDLDKLIDFAQPVQGDAKNELSFALSKFFQNQEILLKCGFKSGFKINISVTMTEKEKKKVRSELNKTGHTTEDSVASRQKQTSAR